MKRLAIIVLLLVLVRGVCAQEQVRFHIGFERPVLHPGQSQTITISASFAPLRGGTAVWDTHGGMGQIGDVLALNDSYFNLVNVNHGATGVYSNPVTNMSIYSFPGIPSSGGVSLIHVGQFEAIELSNPVWLWRATWTPVDYNPRLVTLRSEAIRPVDILLHVGLGFPVPDAWTTFDAESGSQVVPAPSAGCVLLAAPLLAYRRRRHAAP